MMLSDFLPAQLPFSSGPKSLTANSSTVTTSTTVSHSSSTHSSQRTSLIFSRSTLPLAMPLVVRVGPSYDQLQVINVNDDRQPLLINSPHFTGRLVVRVRDFNGTTPAGQPPIRDTDYFGKRRRKFSIQVEGRFKQPINGDELYFGTDFDHLIPTPSIFELGMAAARMVDPAVFYDMQAEKPYIISPLLCGINTLHIRPAPVAAIEQQPSGKAVSATANPSSNGTTTGPLALSPYKLGGAAEFEEETLLDLKPNTDGASLPYKKRRKLFLNPETRRKFVFSPDKEYGFDFFSPHMDFNTFNLKLGISVNVKKYLGGHPVRYTCRNRDGSIVFFVVQFELPDEPAGSESASS